MVQLVTDHSPAAAIEMPNINVSDSFTFTHRRFIQHAASGHPVQSTGAVLAVEVYRRLHKVSQCQEMARRL